MRTGSFGVVLALLSLASAQYCNYVNIKQPQILTPADQQKGAFMGHYTKVKGKYIIAGAYGHYNWTGAVYVFKRDVTGKYAQQQMLLAPKGRPGDYLGLNVDMAHGRYIAAGAPYAKVDGIVTGRAYVWERSDTTWTMVASLTANVPERHARFGYSVAINRNYVFIGSRYARNEILNKTRTGAVFVYAGPKNKLTFLQKLRGRNPEVHWSDELVIGGGKLGVGAPRRFRGEGAAYIFENRNGYFTETAELRHQPPPGVPKSKKDHMGEGIAVAKNGRMFVLGGETANSPSCQGSGAAYVFVPDGAGRWTQQQALFPTTCGPNRFAQRLAVHDRKIVIGGWTSNENGLASGSAYVFTQCIDGHWALQQKITPPGSKTGDYFGKSIDFSNKHIVIGCGQCDSTSNPNQNDGAVYSYEYQLSGLRVHDRIGIQTDGKITANTHSSFPVTYSTNKSGMSIVVQLRNRNSRIKFVEARLKDISPGVGQTVQIGFKVPSTLNFGDRVVLRADLRPTDARFAAHSALSSALVKVTPPPS